jgi:hypothetical protein
MTIIQSTNEYLHVMHTAGWSWSTINYSTGVIEHTKGADLARIERTGDYVGDTWVVVNAPAEVVNSLTGIDPCVVYNKVVRTDA